MTRSRNYQHTEIFIGVTPDELSRETIEYEPTSTVSIHISPQRDYATHLFASIKTENNHVQIDTMLKSFPDIDTLTTQQIVSDLAPLIETCEASTLTKTLLLSLTADALQEYHGINNTNQGVINYA